MNALHGDGTLEPIDLSEIASEQALEWLRRMVLIREFDERCDQLAIAGHIAGGVHSSVGQEAVAVGVASALRDGDHAAGTHRSHHHALAMGMSPAELMAELHGKATGSNGGRGGSMHVADLARGFIGSNGIVGAGVGLAMGAALGFKVRGTGQVAVGYVGDGGVNTGRTWEAVNLAVVWKLPLVVVCENNLYAVETTTSDLTGGDSIINRAAGFGVRAVSTDGQDVAAIHQVAVEAVELARSGEGPTFVEARTYRYGGHNTGQAITYRTDEEVETWRARRDPIRRLRLAISGVSTLDEPTFNGLVASAAREVDEAVTSAHAAPWPALVDALVGVTSLGATVRRLA